MEVRLKEMLQMDDKIAKNGTKGLVSQLVKEVLHDIVHEGKMHKWIVWEFAAFVTSDSFMEKMLQGMVLLITGVVASSTL